MTGHIHWDEPASSPDGAVAIPAGAPASGGGVPASPDGAVAPLISVTALARALTRPVPPVLLDIRWRLGGPPGIEAYRAGHLPGAVFVDLDRDLSGPPGPGGRHPLPSAEPFQAAMRKAGVSQRRPVVVYDEADALAAARGWWVLRYFGHHDVAVLDGGYRAWVAAGGEVVRGKGAAVAAGDFMARQGHMPVLDAAGAAWMARHGVLLDARASERYRGEVEPVDPIAGHIPGALSAPAADNIQPDGRFLPPADLRARFAALRLGPPDANVSRRMGEGGDPAGVTDGVPAGSRAGADERVLTGAYCGSGVTAAHEVLALALAGIPAALYAGSWSEWVTRPDRPVAVGPEPG